jgi:flagellar L-ring protein FlgH
MTKRNLTALAGACLCVIGLAGCQTPHHSSKDEDAFSWTQEPSPAPTNGAVYQTGHDMTLFDNPVAHHVGDIVTIVLNEQTAAQKSAVTTTSKQTTDTLPGSTLIGKAVTIKGNPILNNNIADQTKFDGEGNSQQSNSLTGNITVTVAKVLPNGNLFVKGEKLLDLNQGSEYVRLSGVIRVIDLSPTNTISSSQVANAKISYAGKGALSDANQQSWLARFFNSPWAPF